VHKFNYVKIILKKHFGALEYYLIQSKCWKILSKKHLLSVWS